MAQNSAGVPYKNPTRYTGPSANLVPVVRQPRAPLTTDKNYKLMTQWLIGDNPSTGTAGDLYYLATFSGGDAIWKRYDITGVAPGMEDIDVDASGGTGTDPVEPNASGTLKIGGAIVGNQSIPIRTCSTVANAFDIETQVSAAVTGAPGDKDDAGMSSFDDTQFTVDSDGYVALVGAANLPSVQTITSDNPTVVGPDGSGNIDITGETVANATNAKPIYVDAGANAVNVEVQVAKAMAAAAGDKNDAGICSFDSASFAVDSDGFVTATGGTHDHITQIYLAMGS